MLEAKRKEFQERKDNQCQMLQRTRRTDRVLKLNLADCQIEIMKKKPTSKLHKCQF